MSYLYSFVVYLYVNGSGSITSVGEERANLSAVVYEGQSEITEPYLITF